MPDPPDSAPPVAETAAGLAPALRRALALLEPLAGDDPAAARAADRLRRDLLPRTAGGDACLVVGIVGPNNAGKSALFNALAGRALSPSVPAGGATRRLVGVAAPALLQRLADEPTLARFRIEPVQGAGLVQAALEEVEDPDTLLAVADPTMPPGLMLIDTPDFDSIFRENRLSSEALLKVTDLAVAVVTRHSYQNYEVVEFLRDWLHHGRPWMLVYNEAPDEAVARSHAARLAADVGSQPLAVFWAPHDAGLAQGSGALLPQALGAGPALKEALFGLEEAAGLKSRAMESSLKALRADLAEVAGNLDAEARNARYLLEAVEERAQVAGRRIAAAAMPVAPFVEAFRVVLDRRANLLRKRWRGALRAVWLKITALPSVFRSRAQNEAQKEQDLIQLEVQALRRAWPPLWEETARDLGPEARHPARRRCPAELAALLDADLATRAAPERLARAETALDAERLGMDEFQAECEALVERALDEAGSEQWIQFATDLISLAPLGAAVATVFLTGGLGQDLAVLGGGALSTPATQILTRLLGSSVAKQARNRWTEIRGRQVSAMLLGAVLPASAPVLRRAVDENREAAAALRSLEGELQ